MQQQFRSGLCLVCIASASLLVATTGCGGKQKPKKGQHDLDAEQAVDKKVECNAGDIGACLELARVDCIDKAWSLEYADSPALYVSESGMARVDRQGMLMFSTNTKEWLACVESCPGTDAKNVCMPFGHDMEFATDQGQDCKKSERDAHPWNTHAAKTLQLDCPDGGWEITYVPEFIDVHKALVAAGAIKADDLLATVGGLVVETSFAGYPLMSLEAISNAHCSLFDLPADYKVVTGRQAFDDLREAHPLLERKLDAALLGLRDQKDDPARMARKDLAPQLKSLCEKSGQPTETEADIDQCIDSNVAARALVAKVTARALDRFAQKAAPKFQEVLLREYVTPLCEKFSK